MTIRVLTPADAKAYQALRLEGLRDSPQAFGSSYEEEVNTSAKGLAKKLQANETGDAFILGAFNDNSKLIGILGLEREKNLKFQHKAWLWGMYVTPTERGHGVGRTMLKEVIALAEKISGLEQLILGLFTTQETAGKLYESEGFIKMIAEPKAMRHNGIDYDLARMKLFLKQQA